MCYPFILIVPRSRAMLYISDFWNPNMNTISAIIFKNKNNKKAVSETPGSGTIPCGNNAAFCPFCSPVCSKTCVPTGNDEFQCPRFQSLRAWNYPETHTRSGFWHHQMFIHRNGMWSSQNACLVFPVDMKPLFLIHSYHLVNMNLQQVFEQSVMKLF